MKVDAQIMVRLRLSLLADGTALLLVLTLGNFPFLNESQQTGLGLAVDREGLRLTNVLDGGCFSAEVKDFCCIECHMTSLT